MAKESILWHIDSKNYFKLGLFSLPYYVLSFSEYCGASKIPEDTRQRIKKILYELLLEALNSFKTIYNNKLELHLNTLSPTSIQALKIANELKIRHNLYFPYLSSYNADSYLVDEQDYELLKTYSKNAASIYIYHNCVLKSIYSKFCAIKEITKHIANTINQALVFWNYEQNKSEAYKGLTYMSSCNNYGCVWNLWKKYCTYYEQEFNVKLDDKQTRFYKKHMFKVFKFQ